MRTKLRRLRKLGRCQFTAKIESFSKHETPVACLVRVMCQGKLVADHVWVKADEQFKRLYVGNFIEFEANVTPYVKGYAGTNPKLRKREPQEWDYQLTEVSDIHKIKKRS